MSQLRQPGDYLKHNRTGASPPRIHTFTVESNQKVEKEILSKRRQLFLNSERENSSRQQAREFRTRHRKGQLYTVHKRESRHTRLCLGRDVNREQHRHSNKSYGTTGGQRSQPGATTKNSGPSYESYSRTTQDQGRSHRGIRMTTRHHCPRLVCTRSLQH